MLNRNANEGELSRDEDPLDKLVPVLTIPLLMAPVIQLDAEEGASGLGIAEKKIDVLAIDLVPIGSKLAGFLCLHAEQIAEPYLGTHDRLVRDCRAEDQKKAPFGRRQEISAQ